MTEQTKIFSIGVVPAGTTGVFSFQWDNPFASAEYATAITISSNARMPNDPSDKGLRLVGQTRRLDGMDIMLENPHDADQDSDTLTVWAGQ